jgi:hypothetical protein
MKALPGSATFGLLAVPQITSDLACDYGRAPRLTEVQNDEHLVKQNGARRHASDATERRTSKRCAGIIWIVAGALITGAIASACVYRRPANTTVIHLDNEERISERRKRIDMKGSAAHGATEIEGTAEPVVRIAVGVR